MPFTYVATILCDDYDITSRTDALSLAIDLDTLKSLLMDATIANRILYYPANTSTQGPHVLAYIILPLEEFQNILIPIRLIISPEVPTITEDLYLPSIYDEPLTDNYARILLSHSTVLPATYPLPLSTLRVPTISSHPPFFEIVPESYFDMTATFHRAYPVSHTDMFSSLYEYVTFETNSQFIVDFLSTITTSSSNPELHHLIPLPTLLSPATYDLPNMLALALVSPIYDSSSTDTSTLTRPILSGSISLSEVVSTQESRGQILLSSNDDPDTPNLDLSYSMIPTAIVYYHRDQLDANHAYIHMTTRSTNRPFSINNLFAPAQPPIVDPPQPAIPSPQPPRRPTEFSVHLAPFDFIESVFSFLTDQQIITSFCASTIATELQATDPTFHELHELVSHLLSLPEINLNQTISASYNAYVNEVHNDALSFINEHNDVRNLSAILTMDTELPVPSLTREELIRRCLSHHLPFQVLQSRSNHFHHCSLGLLCPLNWSHPLLKFRPTSLLKTSLIQCLVSTPPTEPFPTLTPVSNALSTLRLQDSDSNHVSPLYVMSPRIVSTLSTSILGRESTLTTEVAETNDTSFRMIVTITNFIASETRTLPPLLVLILTRILNAIVGSLT